MADISRIRVDSTTYDLKDARLPAPGADGTTLVADDGAWTVGTVGGDSPVESGTGVGSVQSKQFVFDHDDDGEETTFVQAATGEASFAVGAGTTASGMYSHAEGLFTTARGNRSHAEGDTTVARGNNSHVEGEYTIARGDNQHVSGKYNIEDMDEEYAEIVGNGESTSARSNARTLDWNGNAWYAGVVSSNAYPNDIVSDDDALTTTEAVHQILNEEVPVETGTRESRIYAGAIQTKPFTDDGNTFHQYAMAVGANAFGMNCLAEAKGSFAEGYGTEAGGVYAHAEGQGTHAYGEQSHAEGIGCEAGGESSHVEGYATVTRSAAEAAHSEGIGTTATSRAQHVQGRYNIVDSDGIYAHIVGNGTNTTCSNAHTLDWSGNAWYAGKVSAGTVASPAPVTNANDLATKAYVDANAGGDNPVESGSGVGSVQTKAYTVGSTTYTQTASGQGAFAEGARTTASGNNAHAEGNNTHALANNAHAEGSSTFASGQQSHAEGGSTRANNDYSHAEGYGTIALANGSHVEGAYGRATGQYSHVEGWDDFWSHTISSSSLSLVSGTTYRLNVSRWPYYLNVGCILAQSYDSTTYYKVTAIDLNARTITLDNNLSDTTINYYVFTLVAVGDGSHAEGSSVAMASYSHAEGEFCVSSGSSSHSEGYNTIAKGNYQHVDGKFNVEDTDNKYAHITGIGTSATSRANGFTVDWNGNGAFATSVQTPKVDTQYLQVGYHGQGGQAFGQALTHGGVIEGTGVLANIGHVEGTPNLLAIGRMYITGSYTSYNYDPNDSQIANTIKNAYTGCVLHIPSLGLYGILETLDTSNNSIVVQYLEEEITDPTLAYLYNPNVYGENSHAEGDGPTVLSRYSHAEGRGTTVGGVTLTVQDTIDHHLDVVPDFNNTPRNGEYSHAEGYRTSIIGQYAHAQGFMSQVFGNAAHAGGLFSVAYGNGSTANAAAGMISVHDFDEHMSYGWYQRSLTLTARLSDQEYTDDYDGDGAYSRRFSFADDGASIGILPGMVAIYQVGVYKLARKILSIDFTGHIVVFDGPLPFENISTQNTIELTVYVAAASGEASHCEGLATVAGGNYSHAEGECTVALGDGQHVSGRANIVDTNNTYASIVGNGTFTSDYAEGDAEFSINVNNRSNAYTLDWSGNGWFAGNITANGGSLTLHDSTGDVTVTAAQLRQLLAMLS